MRSMFEFGRALRGGTVFRGLGIGMGVGARRGLRAPSRNARRLTVAVLISLCISVCVFAVSAPVAGAATQIGIPGNGSGQLWDPAGVAVDATGDVYVADPYNYRVDKFGSAGNFLLAWGEGVADGAAERETCTTTCQKGGEFSGERRGVAVDNDPLSASYGDVYVSYSRGGVEKFGPSGEFLLSFATKFEQLGNSNNVIAVGPGGLVYVGGEAQVLVYEPSGVLKEKISLSGLSSTASVTTLTVDASGDVFVTLLGVPGVHEFEPGGVEKGFQFDAPSTSVEGLALDGSGHLFVSEASGGYYSRIGFHVLEYDAATGAELENFAENAISSSPSQGLAFSQTTGDLYAPESFEGGVVQVLTPPAPGPLVEGEVATPEPMGVATLEARVDPEGAETTYSFEYVAEAQFQATGFAGATGTSPVSIPAGFEEQSAVVHLTGLSPGVTYHWRVVAHNAKGSFADPGQVFEETPAALVSGPWATDVASTSATLDAQINPLGASTEYRLEYGTSLPYEQVVSGSLGEGTTSIPVSRHLQELLPSTVYHYRVVTHSTVGTFESVDHTFTTQAAGGESGLPDGRAWELVSPPDKNGALITPFESGGVIQAASDGSAITYVASEIVGEGAVGKADFSQVLSTRGAGGWGSQALTIPHHIPKEETAAELTVGSHEYEFFTPDLSSAVVLPQSVAVPLSPEATGRTVYVHNNVTGSFVPMVYPGNIPPGTVFDKPNGGGEGPEGMLFDEATPDASHVLLSTSYALTPEANVAGSGGQNLYEWSAGRLQLVNILPNGKASEYAQLGRHEAFTPTSSAMSNEGRWVVWHEGETEGGRPSKLYVRDMVGGRTVRMGGAFADFVGISSDGSKVFFVEGGDLYEFDTGSDTAVDLTAHHGAGETSAGVETSRLQLLDAVRVSEDGSYVYIGATGVLADGGVSGANNLYALHEEGGVWSTRYVGALSSEGGNLDSSQVSPNGRYLVFMSDQSLTGYDNHDVNSGQPDEEVFLYDAAQGKLVCASCNPTGARPQGVEDTFSPILLADPDHEWTGHWLAGSLVGPVEFNDFVVSQPRLVSDSGRVFFNSSDALVPQDTNGLMDVYEYEPVDVGSCAPGDQGYSERSGGCVGLISSGTSSGESVFMDASENGDDAFFVTTSRLSSADYDSGYDVYDAHVCSSTVPCTSVPVSPPECTTVDSCKAAPSPQPEIFGPTPSATFSGIGNVVEEAKSVAKHKTKTKSHAKKKKKKKKKKGKGSRAKGSRAGRAKHASAGGASMKSGRRSS